MKKRLTLGLAAGALVAAMLPGAAMAGATAEEKAVDKCVKEAAKVLDLDEAAVTATFDAIWAGTNGPNPVWRWGTAGPPAMPCSFQAGGRTRRAPRPDPREPAATFCGSHGCGPSRELPS